MNDDDDARRWRTLLACGLPRELCVRIWAEQRPPSPPPPPIRRQCHAEAAHCIGHSVEWRSLHRLTDADHRSLARARTGGGAEAADAAAAADVGLWLWAATTVCVACLTRYDWGCDRPGQICGKCCQTTADKMYAAPGHTGMVFWGCDEMMAVVGNRFLDTPEPAAAEETTTATQ